MNEIAVQTSKYQELVKSGCYSTDISETIKSAQLISDSLKQMITVEHINCLRIIAQSIADVCNAFSQAIISSGIEALLNSARECIQTISYSVHKQMIQSIAETVKVLKPAYNRLIFLKIIDETGYPMYLEQNTELEEELIASYKRNGYQCNIPEMREIIFQYFNDDYLDRIVYSISNAGIFDSNRVSILEQGIAVYRLGFYGPAGSTFADHMSGMIRDIYTVVEEIHRFSRAEKTQLLALHNQHCKIDSEKSMLLQILCVQNNGLMTWQHVAQYFLDVTYKSGERDMETQPKRPLICHGIQTNYNNQEMVMKLILCLDILVELAWRVKKMREESEVIIDIDLD